MFLLFNMLVGENSVIILVNNLVDVFFFKVYSLGMSYDELNKNWNEKLEGNIDAAYTIAQAKTPLYYRVIIKNCHNYWI